MPVSRSQALVARSWLSQAGGNGAGQAQEQPRLHKPALQGGRAPTWGGHQPGITLGSSRVSRGFPVPAANTTTATASSPQAPRAPQARKLQDPPKLTVFLLRTRHGGVTSWAGFNEVSPRARRSGLGPASSARRETPRPALPGPARKRTRPTAACL